MSHDSAKSLDGVAMEMERNTRNAATEHAQLTSRLLSSVETESQLHTERLAQDINTLKEDTRRVCHALYTSGQCDALSPAGPH